MSCTSGGPHLYAEPWPEADVLFRSDSRWVGGDGAYSTDLGGGRVLWAFGDSFVATSLARERTGSRMVRNSVAIQTGYDPTRAFAQFYWREQDGEAQSFIPEEPPYWFWPGPGVRWHDRLLWFTGRVFQESEGMWGFAAADWVAWLIDNPDDEPSQWHFTRASARGDRTKVQLGGAVLVEEPWLYVYGNGGDWHALYLARFELERAFDGDLAEAHWWTGSGWGDEGHRAPLFDTGAPEYSVHWAAPLGCYLLCSGPGFGPTTITVRSAPRPEGPWSAPRDVLRPPESFVPDSFVYAAKGHPEQEGADLALTYVPSSFEPVARLPDDDLYYPRFVRASYR